MQTPETESISLSDDFLFLTEKCCYLSHQAYMKPEERDLPPSLGKVEFSEVNGRQYYVPYFILEGKSDNILYISCRGTSSRADCMTDAQGSCLKWLNGYVHRGIFQAAVHLFSHIEHSIVQRVRAFHQQIVVTGHSLGGGVAALLAMLLHEYHPEFNIHAIVFAPAAVMSEEIWIQASKFTYSFGLRNDCVPFLCLKNGWNLRMAKYWLSKMVQIVTGLYEKSESPYVRPDLMRILEQHPLPESKSAHLYPPGCFHVMTRGNAEMVRVKSLTYFHVFPRIKLDDHKTVNIYQTIQKLSAMRREILKRDRNVHHYPWFLLQNNGTPKRKKTAEPPQLVGVYHTGLRPQIEVKSRCELIMTDQTESTVSHVVWNGPSEIKPGEVNVFWPDIPPPYE